MSFPGDIRQPPAASISQLLTDPQLALSNLSAVQYRMDSLQKFLSDSVNANTRLCQPQIDAVSSEISAAIHQIIVNGSALVSCNPPLSSSHPNPEIQLNQELDDYEIIEMDAVELLAEHVHFCEICGKGFKRDANLRMHMRAHGNQFKTRAALSKPGNGVAPVVPERTRFSCPYVGCNRNKGHKKFRPLKSAICVKNHFKRSHCPKTYSCGRCNKKRFSVVADLKSHLKHCGESKWRCCCGTSFSRKDKLFGHMALFEGHMPAVVVDEGVPEEMNSLKDELECENEFFEGLIGGDHCFQDVLNSPNFVNNLDSGIDEGFFQF